MAKALRAGRPSGQPVRRPALRFFRYQGKCGLDDSIWAVESATRGAIVQPHPNRAGRWGDTRLEWGTPFGGGLTCQNPGHPSCLRHDQGRALTLGASSKEFSATSESRPSLPRVFPQRQNLPPPPRVLPQLERRPYGTRANFTPSVPTLKRGASERCASGAVKVVPLLQNRILKHARVW